jgi:hypothetical protein
MEKVKVSKEIKDAIEDFRMCYPESFPKNVMQVATEQERFIGKTVHCHTLKLFAELNFNGLLQSLVVGYEVEQTPEDKVRELFKNPGPFYNGIGGTSTAYRDGIRETLDALNIKISGVNDQ